MFLLDTFSPREPLHLLNCKHISFSALWFMLVIKNIWYILVQDKIRAAKFKLKKTFLPMRNARKKKVKSQFLSVFNSHSTRSVILQMLHLKGKTGILSLWLHQNQASAFLRNWMWLIDSQTRAAPQLHLCGIHLDVATSSHLQEFNSLLCTL